MVLFSLFCLEQGYFSENDKNVEKSLQSIAYYYYYNFHREMALRQLLITEAIIGLLRLEWETTLSVLPEPRTWGGEVVSA